MPPCGPNPQADFKMKHGPGWIVLEEGLERPKLLVTILPSRRSVTDVAAHIEQLYIDRHSSISERLAYKKSRKHATYVPMIDSYSCIIHCGHNPWLVAFPARSIELHNNVLSFTYRLPIAREGAATVFETRRQSITIDA
jgi:hypothetical protein